MPHAPSTLLMIVAFVALLGPLVTIHELGHYLVGRWCGVRVDAFSVGFGRELFGWTDRRGTRWKLSAIPLGGYVRFAGDADIASTPMAPGADVPAQERARWLNNRPLWQRALVVFAGPGANILFAALVFALFNLAYGYGEASPVIAEFVEPSPAHGAGLAVGDRIVAVDGAAVSNFAQIREKVLLVPGETLAIGVIRGQRSLTVPVRIGTRIERDGYGNESRVGLLGIAAGRIEIVPVGPVRALTLAFDQCWTLMRVEATGLRQIVTGRRSASELGGPVRIARYSGERLALGWREFVYFAALISMNLAFVNLLPIPVLDGGHLLFYALEAVRRKPLNTRSQEWAIRMGVAFVLALMMFITLNDLASLRIFGG